ncbi:hypothetical protein I5U23_09855 [Stenotrophomonas maltophilia]|uniref:AbiTii domain-containing protein n=1 Tax=Stenotrophomonas riyadhensis TaxID=2859893 RepID=A0ABT2XHI4_9GAMM|nr:hypothetical protein [Stenotrophomonas sp. CFS3442]MBH1618218.1 hypothetical protein [Stenotrophomonas maltophilia]MCV0325395.1 hypothetical protein [Stenotrophomonas sp. CFS3442]HEL4244407.1 hypothetical protein [Stenotrophomonas maltophilia]
MNDIFREIHFKLLQNQATLADALEALKEALSASHQLTPNWHALGFIHCKLFESEAGTLRLHIWPPNERSPLEQKSKIHDHIFDLKSLVLCGQITNVLHTESDRIETPSKAFELHYVEYNRQGSRLIASGKEVFAAEKIRSEIKKGNTYQIQKGMLHDSQVSIDELTATIVATYGHVQERPRMLGTPGETPPKKRELVAFPTIDWENLIQKVIDELRKESGA